MPRENTAFDSPKPTAAAAPVRATPEYSPAEACEAMSGDQFAAYMEQQEESR